MRVIHKYVMDSRDFEAEMPSDSQVLSVQMQGDLPSIWVMVDPNIDTRRVRHFISFNTGQDFFYDPPALRFIGTVQSEGIVNHIFEVL